MEISEEQTDGAVVLRVRGDLDMHSSPRLRESILEQVKQKTPTLVVSLNGVTSMDSSGLATLREALQKFEANGARLVIVAGRENVKRIFALYQAEPLFEMFAEEETALSTLPRQ